MITFKNSDYFLKIVEKRNISKAAQELYISQPALSKYLSRLEEELGVTLFDRNHNPLTLTLAGEIYLKYVKEIKERQEALQEEFSEIHKQNMAKIKLGCGIWHSTFIMPALLTRLKQDYPLLDVDVWDEAGKVSEERLKTGELDIAFLTPSHYDSSLEYIPLLKENIVLAANKSIPAVKKYLKEKKKNPDAAFDITNLNDANFIQNIPEQNIYHIIKGFLNNNQLKPKFLWKIRNNATMMNMVNTGPYYAFVPESAVLTDQYQFLNNLELIPVNDPLLHGIHFMAVYQKRNYMVPKYYSIIIDEVKKAFPDFAAE